MKSSSPVDDRPGTPRRSKYELLERITAVTLGLVAVAVAWILLAAHGVAWVRLSDLNWEVVPVLGVTASAMGLVSIVALLQTRE